MISASSKRMALPRCGSWMAMRARAAQKNADIELAVSAVMQNVKGNGLSAVRDYSRQFDQREPYELTRAQLEEAYAAAVRRSSSPPWSTPRPISGTTTRSCSPGPWSGPHRTEAGWAGSSGG